MRRKKGEPVDIFWCETCRQTDAQGMTKKEAIAHLLAIHKLKTPTGKKQMVMHLDGEKFYESQYKWIFGKVEMSELYHGTRVGEDRAIWKNR